MFSKRNSYLIELSTWFIPYGMQLVLFPWLVVIVLQGSGSQLGLVQASFNLPLLLLPLTGLLAERMNLRTLILWGHFGATLPPLALIFALKGGSIHYWTLIGAGLGYGLMSALSMPAREAMLVSVAGGQLQRTVAMATACQFGVQAFGYLIAGQAERLTPEIVLIVQIVVLLIGAIVTRFGLPANTPAPQKEKISLSTTLKKLRQTPVFATMALNASLGLLYLSAYSVLVPLILRDEFDGTATDIATSFIAFMAGVVTANIIQTCRPLTKRLGRQAILSPLIGAGVLIAIVFASSLWVMILLLMLWGVGAGFTLSSTRTLVLIYAPEDIRGRTLALYQLAFLGVVPPGSVIMGWLADSLSAQVALSISALTMAIILITLIITTDLWQTTEKPEQDRQ